MLQKRIACFEIPIYKEFPLYKIGAFPIINENVHAPFSLNE